MAKAQELYACNKCGKYPIIKIVDLQRDEKGVEPTCPSCGGDTHFEKVYPLESDLPTRLPLKGNPAYDLMM